MESVYMFGRRLTPIEATLITMSTKSPAATTSGMNLNRRKNLRTAAYPFLNLSNSGYFLSFILRSVTAPSVGTSVSAIKSEATRLKVMVSAIGSMS